MALKRCAHCRYLFEAEKDVCPACKRPLGAIPSDDKLEDRRTLKVPAVKKP
jgi:hypothetical protein